MSKKPIQRDSRRGRQAVVVGLELAGDVRPVVQDHEAVLDVGLEHVEVVVRAEVVVEVEALDAHEAVELEPFGEIVRLVAVDRAGGQVVLGRLFRGRRPSSSEAQN